MSATAHMAETTLHRDGDDIAVTVEIEWSYDDNGVYLERGHRLNGYGRGWYCDKLEARDAAGMRFALTESEKESLMEEFHPKNLPDPRDCE